MSVVTAEQLLRWQCAVRARDLSSNAAKSTARVADEDKQLHARCAACAVWCTASALQAGVTRAPATLASARPTVRRTCPAAGESFAVRTD